MIAKPRVLIFSGYGLNCEDETKFAFDKSGATSEIVHINDLIDKRRNLSNYQIAVFPGGFSFGDDTGSGNAFTWRIKNHLSQEMLEFVHADKLILGICNGFQIATNLGLVPGFDGDYSRREVVLFHNDSARYDNRWVDLEFSGKSPWIRGLERMSLPIAHGEGKFYAGVETLRKLNERGQVAARYIRGEICEYFDLEANPNGALEDIAAITDQSGRILGMMPHPERAIHFTHLPNWPLLKEKARRENRELQNEGPGIQIFKNGVNYFK